MTPSRYLARHARTEVLARSARAQLVRVWPDAHGPSLLAKLHLDPGEDGSHLSRELAVFRSLESPRVVRALRIDRLDTTVVLLLEDPGAPVLSQRPEEPLPLRECVLIARETALALNDLHDKGLIHRSLGASSVAWDAGAEALWLVELGSAVLLREVDAFPDTLHADELAYTAPEQTGRLKRSVDERTDLYRLGCLLYELLTGSPPFDGRHPSEWLHRILAQTPTPPSELREMPPPLSRIALRLLAKSPEDRYQSVEGLNADLDRVLELMSDDGSVEDFELAQKDIVTHLRLPETLYGRAKELDALNAAVARVSGGARPELLFIEGFAGSGKTSVVRAASTAPANQQCLFGEGKFVQFQGSAPYAALGSALDSIVAQLSHAPPDTLETLAEEFQLAVGSSGKLLLDLIPSLGTFIGVQPPVAQLGPAENQNRFTDLIHRFIGALTMRNQTAVLFLDDLQWMGTDSAALVTELLSSAQRNLLIVGSYRTERPQDLQALNKLRSDAADASVRMTTLRLRPMTAPQVAALLADTLQPSLSSVGELAAVIVRKTIGNPFFVRVLVRNLYESRLIWFDRTKSGWDWDLPRVEALDLSESALEFTSHLLHELPPEVQRMLHVAAIVGTTFHLPLVAQLLDTTVPKLRELLADSVTRGFVGPDMRPGVVGSPAAQDRFVFVHDRVRQAAYGLFDLAARADLHHRVGVAMSKRPGAEAAPQLFELLEHLNHGVALPRPAGRDRVHIAKLNLDASERSMETTAYDAALSFAAAGLAWLGESAWDFRYALTLDLHLAQARAEYLLGEWDASVATLAAAGERATSLGDEVRVSSAQMRSYQMKNDNVTALRLGVATLAKLGVEVEEFPSLEDMSKELGDSVATLVDDVDIPALYDREERYDAYAGAKLEIMMECVPPAFLQGSMLVPVLAKKMAELCFINGNGPLAPLAFMFYSGLGLATFKHYAAARDYGELALRLHEQKFHSEANAAMLLNLWGGFVAHYTSNLEEAQKALTLGYESGLSTGAHEWAGYCAINRLFMDFWGNLGLGALQRWVDSVLPVLSRIQPIMAQYFYAVRSCVVRLTTDMSEPSEFLGSRWPEFEEVIESSRENNDLLTLFVASLCQTSMCFWAGQYEQAYAFALEAREHLAGAPGLYANPAFHFYYGLSSAVTYEAAFDTDGERLNELRETVATFNHWAEMADSTYAHQANLLEAEVARIEGDLVEAMRLYDAAISGAALAGFNVNAAVAADLACRCARGAEQESRAGKSPEMYARLARVYYGMWGATAKSRGVEVSSTPVTVLQPDGASVRPQRFTSTPDVQAAIDVHVAIAASEAMSQEGNTADLIRRMLQLMIENAGAQRGVLLLEKRGELVVEAEAFLSGQAVQFSDGAVAEGLPMRAIEYVRYSLEPLVSAPGAVANREAELLASTGSAACLPIARQGKLLGVLYLENRLSEGVFSADRMALLRVLAAQAAVSFDNARLYDQLNTKYAELEHFNYVVCHDLREPVRTLMLSLDRVELAMEGKTGPDLDRLVELMHRTTSRMNGMLMALREFARSGGSDVVSENVDLNEILDEVRAILDAQLHEVGGEIRVDAPLPIVYMNRNHAATLLQNFVSNGLKFHGESDAVVTVEAAPKQGGWNVSISDNGIGIPADKTAEVFRPFARLHTSEQYDGLGIGLAACSMILSLYGSKASVESELGVGTTFTFGLPGQQERPSPASTIAPAD